MSSSEKACRLCLSPTHRNIDVFVTKCHEQNMDIVIHQLFSFWIKPTDILKGVCDDCFKLITEFYTFYKNVKEAQMRLPNFQSQIQNVVPNEELIRKNSIDLKYSTDVRPKLESESIDAVQCPHDIEIIFNEVKIEIKQEIDAILQDCETMTEIEALNDRRNNDNRLIIQEEFTTEIDELSENIEASYNEFPKHESLKKLIDIHCELCSNKPKFDTLDEMFIHYDTKHDTKGYVTCCNTRLYQREMIDVHLESHLQSPSFEKSNMDIEIGEETPQNTDVNSHIHQSNVPENKCNCIIESLLKNNFNSLSHADKEKIIRGPKPSPHLNIHSCTKTFKRRFNPSVYENISWICGCSYLSKIFCWPCVLFSKEINVWSKFGYNDLNNFTNARKRHECNQNHIAARVEYKKMKNRIENILNNELKTNKELYNSEVTANRYIISKLIDIICFLSRKEFYFREDCVDNKINYVRLLNLLSDSDILLKNHLEHSTVFKNASNNIQHDLISSISTVLLDEIETEIRSSKFVSIILDESIEINSKTQLSTVIRYVDQNNEILERFIGFSDLNPDALFNHVEDIVTRFHCKEKLIGVSFDAAICSEQTEVRKKVTTICPCSLFVHCYAHDIILILSQSVNFISNCDIFFKSLTSFTSFFYKYPKRVSLLYHEIKKRYPNATPTSWKYDSKIFSMIYDYRKELLKTFNQIIDDEDKWDSDTVINAIGLRHYLRKTDFNFNLHVFSSIFDSANSLTEFLKNNSFDITLCSNEINKFVTNLTGKKDDFESIWNKVSIENLNRKRNNSDQNEDTKQCFKLRYSEIINTVTKSVADRYRDIDHLKFVDLLNVNSFRKYKKKFPENLFAALKHCHHKHFDFVKLKSELMYIYASTEYDFRTFTDLRNIMQNDLKDILFEVDNLLTLVLTMPVTPSSESTFTTLNRIKCFMNLQLDDQSSSLASIVMGNKLLTSLKIKNHLYDKIIKEFSKKEHRLKLIFK